MCSCWSSACNSFQCFFSSSLHTGALRLFPFQLRQPGSCCGHVSRMPATTFAKCRFTLWLDNARHALVSHMHLSSMLLCLRGPLPAAEAERILTPTKPLNNTKKDGAEGIDSEHMFVNLSNAFGCVSRRQVNQWPPTEHRHHRGDGF